MKEQEVTKLGIVDPFDHPLIGNIDDKNFYNVTDYGILVETDYLEKKYSLISENKLSKIEPKELSIIKEKLFLEHLERNTKIINGAHRELENILYSESLNLTPYRIKNIKRSNIMAQYFQEAYNAENKKQEFTEHFMTLYKKYPFSFVNTHPEDKRKEITDYLLTPIRISIEEERDKDNVVINQKIIIDENKNYLMHKSSLFKKFNGFLLKRIKENTIKNLFGELNLTMPKLARLAMLDCQKHLEESARQQEEAKKIIESKEYYSSF